MLTFLFFQLKFISLCISSSALFFLVILVFLTGYCQMFVDIRLSLYLNSPC